MLQCGLPEERTLCWGHSSCAPRLVLLRLWPFDFISVEIDFSVVFKEGTTMPDPEKGRGLAAEIMVEHLLRALLEKVVLDVPEIRQILDKSMRTAGQQAQTEEGYGAIQFITALMAGPFSARPR